MTLTVDNVTHRYPAMAAELPAVLQDVSFKLDAGEQLLLRGISGSGKTTLINILAGLLTPSTGEVEMGEQSVYRLGEAERDLFRRAKIGYVFQTHHLLPILNAWENVAMPLAFAGEAVGKRKAQAIEWLERVGLKEHANSRPGQLSNGQRQRVAIARAMITQPELILADEPTASLDAESGVVVTELLQTACRENDTILFVASHDPQMADKFGRIVDLQYGNWVEA